MGAQGGTTYQGVQLIAYEAAVLKAFEDMVGEAFPHASEIKWSTFEFMARDDQVTGIGMFSKEPRSLPKGLWNLENLEYLWLTDNHLSARRFFDIRRPQYALILCSRISNPAVTIPRCPLSSPHIM